MQPRSAAWAWCVAATPAKSVLSGYVTAYRVAASAIATDPPTLAAATPRGDLGRHSRALGTPSARSPGKGMWPTTLTRDGDDRSRRYRLATRLDATEGGDAHTRHLGEITIPPRGDASEHAGEDQRPPGELPRREPRGVDEVDACRDGDERPRPVGIRER